MEAFVINLDSDTERLEHCLQTLSRAGTHTITRSAVRGSELDEETLVKHVDPGYRVFAVPSVVGIWMSHRRAWEHAAKSADGSEEWLAVFEDDVEVLPEIWDATAKALKSVPGSTDVLLLGYFQPQDSLGVFRKTLGSNPRARKLSEDVFVPEYFAGLHAYLVRRSSAVKLLATLGKVKGHLDVHMSQAAAAGEIEVAAVRPIQAWQRKEEVSYNTCKRPYILNRALSDVSVGHPTDPDLGMCLSYRLGRIGPYSSSDSVDWSAWQYVYAVAGYGLAVHAETYFWLGALVFAVFVALVDPAVAGKWPKWSEAVLDLGAFLAGAAVGGTMLYIVSQCVGNG